MHFSLLQGDKDEFRPSDLIDVDSGDSDNEILAQFRPVKTTKMQKAYNQ